METFKKDENYRNVLDEIGEEKADAFFSYLYSEHHFNPDEVVQFVPNFYNSLSDFLDKENPNINELKSFIDNQMIEYYSLLNKRY